MGDKWKMSGGIGRTGEGTMGTAWETGESNGWGNTRDRWGP